MVKYIEQVSLDFKACLQKRKSSRQTEELKCQIGTNTEDADITNKMTGLEYALETITMLTNIIISNDAIERFLKCMVCVFTTTVVVPARIPVEITFGKRMGKRGFLLTEGQQKGGMYTIELEQDLNRNTNATKSKSDPKVAWKKKTTRERPYNFRLLEVAKMGIGYRDPNFKFPKWKTAFKAIEHVPLLHPRHWNC